MINAPKNGALETVLQSSFSPNYTPDIIKNQALALSANSFAVFPCWKNRAPATRNGFHDASRDPAIVRQMFDTVPEAACVGLATGKPSEASVLDIDFKNGAATWWKANKDKLPPTFTYSTPSGGYHLIFKHPDGLRCSTSQIAPGIDVKAEGGYVIYHPANGFPVVNNAALAEWPEWLVPTEKPAVAASSAPVFCGYAYLKAALRRACDDIANAPEGERNDTLNKAAYSLLRLKNPTITTQQIATELAAAALACGLPAREISSTLASALLKRKF